MKEVIFCSKDISSQTIIENMALLSGKGMEVKIAPSDSTFVIGSNSINTQGELYTVNSNAIDKPENKRNKRLLDIAVSLMLLLTLPIHLILVKRPLIFVENLFKVLFNQLSWVGLSSSLKMDNKVLKSGVIHPEDKYKEKLSEQQLKQLNLLYLKEYNLQMDLMMILKGYRLLGGNIQEE